MEGAGVADVRAMTRQAKKLVAAVEHPHRLRHEASRRDAEACWRREARRMQLLRASGGHRAPRRFERLEQLQQDLYLDD